MKIVILNFILSTSVNGRIIRRHTNRDTMIYNMARGFVDNGHDVTLLAAEEFKPLDDETNDFNVVYFPSRIPKLFRPDRLPYPKGLGKYLRSIKTDVDMVLSVEVFSMPTLIASRICPEKMLIWHELALFQRFAFKIPAKLWYHVVAKIFLQRIPTVTMSPEAHEFLSRFITNVSDRQLSHGADERMFYPTDETDDYFIIVSMLVARKRINTIIESFADFVKNNPLRETRLKIVGEGPEEHALRTLANSLGVGTRVDFLGFMNHKEFCRLERKAIAMLVNTASDNNMVSVTEAVANGTPVLMNTVPNNHIYIRQFELGIACDNWGANELATMVKNRDKFHANCVANREQFTNTGIARSLCNIFKISQL